MEQVTGIPGSLPPLAQFPQSSIRLGILPEEWQACLDAWIFAAEFRLRLIPEHFCHFKLSSKASGLPFLQAYLQSWGHETDKGEVYRPHDQKSLRLHRQCFILLRRLLLETDPPFDCTSGELFSILANGSATFGENLPWKETLRTVWKRDDGRISDALEAYKSSLIQNLPQAVSFSAATQIKLFQVTALVKGLPEAGAVFMTGSDYLDSLITGYTSIETLAKTSAKTDKQRELTANLYVCLSSLMRIVPPHASLMLDHLYSLKGAAELGSTSSPNVATALSSLVCSTSFLRHLDIFLASNEQKRGKTLLTALQKYREQSSHLHVLAVKKISRVQKGKEKAIQNGSIHIHQASQVSQVHDLFPDLSSQHILRLLDHFSNDVESVIAALLEPDSLPPDLQASSDTSSAQPSFQARIQDLAPHPPQSSLPQRRNVFDGDDFDSLQISSSKVHIGRKDLTRTPPTDQNEHAKSKAAIMAALAAFDSDDDERDDTYDVGDVGGTVDDTLDTDTRSQVQKPSTGRDDTFEELLFGAWRNAPEVFARDSKTRLSQPRRKLKEETGMGDEQIEGWAVMLGRDTATMTRLEKKYSLAFAFGGSQHRLAGTKWSVSRSGTATEDDDSGDDGGGQGTGIGRGSSGPLVRGGRGFGRGRGNTAGPTHAASTQAARRRKEQGRGRGGANHNRREGRAKKIGRVPTSELLMVEMPSAMTLLNMPTEIRHLILLQLFVSARGIVPATGWVRAGPLKPRTYEIRPTPKGRYVLFFSHNPGHCNLSSQSLRVCRQILDEGRVILYAENAFDFERFQCPDYGLAFSTFKDVLGRTNLALIRRVNNFSITHLDVDGEATFKGLRLLCVTHYLPDSYGENDGSKASWIQARRMAVDDFFSRESCWPTLMAKLTHNLEFEVRVQARRRHGTSWVFKFDLREALVEMGRI